MQSEAIRQTIPTSLNGFRISRARAVVPARYRGDREMSKRPAGYTNRPRLLRYAMSASS